MKISVIFLQKVLKCEETLWKCPKRGSVIDQIDRTICKGDDQNPAKRTKCCRLGKGGWSFQVMRLQSIVTGIETYNRSSFTDKIGWFKHWSNWKNDLRRGQSTFCQKNKILQTWQGWWFPRYYFPCLIAWCLLYI